MVVTPVGPTVRISDDPMGNTIVRIKTSILPIMVIMDTMGIIIIPLVLHSRSVSICMVKMRLPMRMEIVVVSRGMSSERMLLDIVRASQLEPVRISMDQIQKKTLMETVSASMEPHLLSRQMGNDPVFEPFGVVSMDHLRQQTMMERVDVRSDIRWGQIHRDISLV